MAETRTLNFASRSKPVLVETLLDALVQYGPRKEYPRPFGARVYKIARPRVLAHLGARPRPERLAPAGRDFGAGFLTFRP